MLVIGLILAVLALVAGWCYLHRGYRQRLEATVARTADQINVKSKLFDSTLTTPRESFEDYIVVLPNLLPVELQSEVSDSLDRDVSSNPTVQRSYIPLHKAGGTLSYADLFEFAPIAVALYQSTLMKELVSSVVGEAVTTTPLWDQSSCSLLCYTQPGDRIGWHYDYNFYRGRHFTVLYVIDNLGPNGLSSATLQTRSGGQVKAVPTPKNSLVVFEGSQVFHRVTPLADSERRLILSMTYTTDPSNSLVQGVLRRFKDVAYYGASALWT